MSGYLVLGLAAVCAGLLGALGWAVADRNAQAQRADDLKKALELIEANDRASQRAREIATAGAEHVEQIIRDFTERNAREPVSQACLADPAIGRAYVAIDDLERVHDDAVRGAAGRSSEAVRSSEAHKRPGR